MLSDELKGGLEGLRFRDQRGDEVWSARDLQNLLGYSDWNQFEGEIHRAIDDLRALDMDVPSEIVTSADVTRDEHGEGEAWAKNYLLSRFGAYLVASRAHYATQKPVAGTTSGFVAGQDFIAESRKSPNGGRPALNHIVTLDIVQITEMPTQPGFGNLRNRKTDHIMTLEVKANYRDWFPRMVAYGFDQGKDYALKIERVERQGRGSVEQTNHIMSLDMAKEISMIQRTAKGKQARQYFIEVEKEYREARLTPAEDGSAAEIARLQEDNGKLQEDNDKLRKALKALI